MAYTTTEDVRAVSDLTTSDISDLDLFKLITRAQSRVQRDTSKKVTEERFLYIDNYRKNFVNGENSIFFTDNSFYWPLAVDPDNHSDGSTDLNINDVKVFLYNITNQNRTQLTVSTVNPYGQIVLTTAPPAGKLVFVTYRVSPVYAADTFPATSQDLGVPNNMQFQAVNLDPLIKQATEELTIAFAYSKVEARQHGKITLRDLSVTRMPSGYKDFLNRYYTTLTTINDRWCARVVDGQRKRPWMGLIPIIDDTSIDMGGVSLQGLR